MALNQIKLYLFFSLYFLIISNSLIVFANNFEYNFTLSVLGITVFLFISLFFLSYILIFLINKLTKNIFFYFFILLLFFSSLTSTLNPNIPEPNESLKFIFLINFLTSVILSLITIRFKIYNFFILFSFITILASTIYLIINIFQNYYDQKAEINKVNFEVSKNLNIFVVSFDNLPSEIMEKKFKKTKNLDDFVFFNKFISSSQSTFGNIIFEMHGNEISYEKTKTKKEYLNEIKLSKNNLFYLLEKEGIKRNFYGRYNSLIGKDELVDFNKFDNSEKIPLTFQRFVIPSLERFFTYKLRLFYNEQISNKYFFEHKQSLKQFKIFMNNIKNSNYTDDIVVNYGHWFFTQPPISLRENCKFMKNVPQKIDQINQSAECSFKLIEDFIKTLKLKKIYKNSVVIFKSDSGVWSSLYSKSNILSSSKNFSNYGYSMYRPFLIIKPLESKNNYKINESIISTVDLSNYYCKEINKFKKLNCNLFGNQDLYDALYLNKTTSNKKIMILFDNGLNTHLMHKSIFKNLNVVDGDIDKPFIKIFSN